jgi:hypothetical protein
MVAEARAGGRCNMWVGREATRGHPCACGGWSEAASAGGGPLAWRRSHGEEDNPRGAAFGTTAQCAQWSGGRTGAV